MIYLMKQKLFSWGDASLVAPASASLTYICSASWPNSCCLNTSTAAPGLRRAGLRRCSAAGEVSTSERRRPPIPFRSLAYRI